MTLDRGRIVREPADMAEGRGRLCASNNFLAISPPLSVTRNAGDVHDPDLKKDAECENALVGRWSASGLR